MENTLGLLVMRAEKIPIFELSFNYEGYKLIIFDKGGKPKIIFTPHNNNGIIIKDETIKPADYLFNKNINKVAINDDLFKKFYLKINHAFSEIKLFIKEIESTNSKDRLINLDETTDYKNCLLLSKNIGDNGSFFHLMNKYGDSIVFLQSLKGNDKMTHENWCILIELKGDGSTILKDKNGQIICHTPL